MLCTIIVLTGCLTALADNEIKVILDGRELQFDVPAQAINGRTMVPVRKIFEELGMTVDWYNESQKIVAYKNGIVLEFVIDTPTICINAVELETDIGARIVDGRTLVPVRIVSEYAGADVYWDENTNTVYINSNDSIKYLDWNESVYYWGKIDSVDPSAATGFGILYSKENNKIIQAGLYLNSKIVRGADFLESGEYFEGIYHQDGTWKNGTCLFDNGDWYTGDFLNSTKHGTGTYFYKNGSYHEGEWKNDLPNGYGILYDAVEDVQYEGNYVNGKREGEFVIKDFYLNQTYYATYRDGVYIDEAQKKQEEKNKRLEEINKKVNELAAEYEELDAWYENELEELYDYITNGDPFATDWAKEIYEYYGVNKYASPNSSPADSNIDSFAAANATRQQADLQAKANANAYAAIISYNQTYIDNLRQLINETYTQQKALLDQKRETLLVELDMLERY